MLACHFDYGKAIPLKLPRVNCPRFLVKLLFNQRFDPIDDRFCHNSGAMIAVMSPIGVNRRHTARKQT